MQILESVDENNSWTAYSLGMLMVFWNQAYRMSQRAPLCTRSYVSCQELTHRSVPQSMAQKL